MPTLDPSLLEVGYFRVNLTPGNILALYSYISKIIGTQKIYSSDICTRKMHTLSLLISTDNLCCI